MNVAAKVPRLAPAGALLCHVLIFVLLHLQSVTAEAQPGHHADDTQGRGEGGNAETEELKIKYPNNCSGLYSDLIEIISSCFVSLFQGCILHFSSEASAVWAGE